MVYSSTVNSQRGLQNIPLVWYNKDHFRQTALLSPWYCSFIYMFIIYLKCLFLLIILCLATIENQSLILSENMNIA